MARKKVIQKRETRPTAKDLIKNVVLNEKASSEYYIYGTSVIEDRAIFGSLDGLIPVLRRSLWSAHELGLHHKAVEEKSAKVVGHVIGNYHAHGDTSCYASIVNAVNSPCPTFKGVGNFGTMTDTNAAMRYTNIRLSKYADLTFFDKFYLHAIDYVPNYDGSRREPLVLPALLPNTILNGNFGIAPGVNTRVPCYTLASVFKVLKKAVAAGKCTPEHCLELDFTSKYGGVVKKTKAAKPIFLDFYKTGRGRFTFHSTSSAVERNEIRIDRFAPFADIDKVLVKVENIKGVTFTRDDGDKHDVYQKAWVIGFAKSLKGPALDAVVSKVMKEFSATQTFNLKATERYIDKLGNAAARLFPATVPQLIQLWIDHRIALEVRACSYWIKRREDELADLELLRLAVKMRETIIKALGKKISEDELVKWLSKTLNITEVQANRILDLKIRQLRALEDEKLVAKIKELKSEKAGYVKRRDNPVDYVLQHLNHLEKELVRV